MLEATNISYEETSNFSNFIIDYLAKDPKLDPFISHFPSLENLKEQIISKKKQNIDRRTLVKVLKSQHVNSSISKETDYNINSLISDKTFSVTTGHQLCLFTGPLYFIYKILSTINLSEQLRLKYPENNFVPIYWMASEDHDFDEINHINIFGKKLEWKTNKRGAVGRMNMSDIESLIKELNCVLGKSDNADRLLNIFKNAYLNNNNLADATRCLVYELFSEYGLVIIDGDDAVLKKKIIPILKKDILHKGFEKAIKICSLKFSKYYKPQAYVRDRNFFRLSKNKREIINNHINEDDIDNSYHTFSPNVLLRPLYQEIILPNIAYVGGAAEVAYWMQIKLAFDQEKIPFPVLVLRNSAMLIDINNNDRRRSLKLSIFDLFLDEHKLQRKFILKQKNSDISIDSEKKDLIKVYESLINKIDDIGLKTSLASQLQKDQNFLKQMEQKLFRLDKKYYEDSLKKLSKLKQSLFPDNGLQERYDNFIPFYLSFGESFIKIMKDNLDPLKPNFVVLAFKKTDQ